MSEKITRVGILISYALFTLLPIYWVGTLSFQKEITFPPQLIPNNPSINHYVRLFTTRGIPSSILNSLIVALTSALISVVICSMAGYAFSQLKMKGKKIVFGLVLITQLLPPALNIIPTYSVFSELGLLNNRLGLILLYQLANMPLNIFLFTNYFDTVEDPIVEAAIVDGAGPVKRFFSIFLPLSKPAIIAGYLFAFRFSWMEYLYASTFIRERSKNLFPAMLRLAVRSNRYTYDYGIMAAGAIILLIPAIGILVFGQKYLRAGLQLGGVD